MQTRNTHTHAHTRTHTLTLTHALSQKLKANGAPLTHKFLIRLNYHCLCLVRRVWLLSADWDCLLSSSAKLEQTINVEDNTHITPMVLLFRWRFCIGGTLLAILSLLLLWACVVMQVPVELSPISHLLRAMGTDNYVAFVLVTLTLLVYFFTCAVWPLFKIRLFEYYQMRGGRQTASDSLLINSSYLLRLVPPLTYTFSSMQRVEHSAFEYVRTAYTRI